MASAESFAESLIVTESITVHGHLLPNQFPFWLLARVIGLQLLMESVTSWVKAAAFDQLVETEWHQHTVHTAFITVSHSWCSFRLQDVV